MGALTDLGYLLNPYICESAPLSAREQQVAKCIARGVVTPTRIARKLGMTRGAARSTRHNAMTKLLGFALRNTQWLPVYHSYVHALRNYQSVKEAEPLVSTKWAGGSYPGAESRKPS